jgi:co-chaperonin GroES (HSP10)
MKAPSNYLFVQVDSEYNDRYITPSGIELYLTTKRFAEDDEKSNANFKPMMVQRHYGIVVGVPGRLSSDDKIRQVDPGFPAPSRYIPSEQVEAMVTNWIANNGKTNAPPVDSYSCLPTFVHKWETADQFEMEAQVGDKIYFHYNTVDDENLIPYAGDKVYKLKYSQALCVVRDGIIFPVAGTVLVEPIWEEGVEDLGEGKKGKVSQSGIVTELHEKPKHLEGIVRYVCSPMKGEETGLKPGDKIIYIQHADWEIDIEGKTFYVMKYWDILAKIEE